MNILGQTRAIQDGLAILAFAAALVGPGVAQADRIEIGLGGTWEYQKVAALNYPPSNNRQTITVPGFLSGWNYERAWFRRRFTLPSNVAGTQLRLECGGVKYGAQVWLNGSYVGGYLNGYEPFNLEITPVALPGQTNELIVGVSDWTATFSAPVDFNLKPADQNARDFVRTNILAPIGGRYEQYGIWQPVKVLSTPAVSLSDVFVMPSVRTQQLTVRLTLRNDSGSLQAVTLTNRVLEGTTPALTLPLAQLNVPPNTNVTVDLSAAWSTARLWSHLDPHLYTLETTLVGATGSDVRQTRFGFREFWTEGGRFFLNGTPINLLASATWPPSTLQATSQIAQVLLDVKAGNNVALRLHTQPWDAPWYDLADQIGLLIVEEFAVWCDPSAYKLSDTNFWNNYAQHLAAAVRRDRNHPSIVLWSLENEILHCGGQRLYSATEAQLAAMGRLVKALDPTRPITYEADLDPGGEAHVVGLHYPHEFPDHHVWPNAAWWMDQPITRDWVPGGQWTWDRLKPLYIGEFLWVPSTSAADFTILFGDAAYTDPGYYRNLAKGLTWRMQIEAYRAYGVNGICPWTMFEDPVVPWGEFNLKPAENFLYQTQKAAYHPNAIFPEEYHSRFFAGETGRRTLRVYNDQMAAGDFTLRWRVGGSGWQTRDFSLPPAGQRRETIEFNVPANAGAFPLDLELRAGSSLAYSNMLACAAWPRPTLALPAGVRLGLYDPPGATASLLGRFAVPFLLVTNLQTIPFGSINVLMVGRHALTHEPVPEVGPDTRAAQWQAFAAKGGWVLILEQTNYPSWLPAALQLSTLDASFAFPNPDHAVTADLTAEDLRWWAPDHRLVTHALRVPSRGNFRVLAAIGSTSGLEYAAALEIPVGPGGWLASQWLVSERFDAEPLAGALLQRLLDYCGPGQPRMVPRSAGLLAETNAPAAIVLAGLGLQAENFLGRLSQCDPAIYPVLCLAGSNTVWEEAGAKLAHLTSYVERGGRLVLHRPSASFLAVAQPAWFPELEIAEADLSLVVRREVTSPAVRLSNHDLYWIEQPGAWDKAEVLSTNLAHRYYRKRFNLATYNTIQVENMPIHTSGGPGTGGWWLWSNGYVAQNINISQAGTYLFNILAKGTTALGGWPRMLLRIDGKAQDSLYVTTNQLAFFTLSADLTPGTHQLAVAFDNDAYAPPEDRNLFLDEIRWGRDSDSSPARLLSRPGAVAEVRRGAGLILLDEIAWESEGRNATKAGRHASLLLGGLGASFRTDPALAVEAETMTNVNVAAYSVWGGMARLNSNGRIEAPVRFTASGYYIFEILASGTSAQGVLPQMAIVLNGVNRTNWFLTTTNLNRYFIRLLVNAGTYNLGLAFLNDFYAPPEDRNLALDRLTIRPEPRPRLLGLIPDLQHQTATLQWETGVGQTSEIQWTPDLASGTWLPTAPLLSLGNVLSWRDDGALTGAPPFGSAAPRRYYRVRQTSP